MELGLHRHAVAKALGDLETKLQHLVDALAHGAAAVEVEPSDTTVTPIRRICEAYSAIDYLIGEDVGSSIVCLGVVGVSSEILRQAAEVNAAKAKLKTICSPLQGILTRIPVKGESSPTKAIPVIRVVLRNIQRSSLSLLAAYRKIPILGAPPASITYTRANTRAVYRKSVEALYNDLLKISDTPGAAADRARLSTLDPRETHLALVKDRYPNVRANVLYARLDARGRGRVQISAELPIIYPQGRDLKHPSVRFADTGDRTSTPQRRQAKLEAEPFLQTLPVYRYSH